MAKKRSIFETEHPANPDKTGVLPPEDLLRQMEQDALDEPPPDPNEMIWTGGNAPFDLNSELDNDLDDVTALDEILLAIIASYCSFDYPPEEGSDDAKKIRRRLEQSKRFLLDRPAKHGTPTSNEREVVWNIAKEFWLVYATQTDEESTLTSIARDIVLPNWQQHNYDPKDVENVIRPFINAFKKDRDRLLLRVSAAGLPEIETRKPTVRRIIKLLGDLGIVTPAHTSFRRK